MYGVDILKNAFVNRSLDIIKNSKECDEIELKKLRYGLEGFYSFITKYIFILIINIILGTVLEFIIFHLAYAFIRSVGFGLHAKTNIGCWIFSTIINVGIPLIIKYYYVPKNILIVLWLISFIAISIFAPADTKKRPLIRKKQRIQNKIIAIIVCLVYLLLMIFLDNFIVNTLVYALLFEAVMVNPLSYLLTKQSFNNYKNSNV